GAGAPVRGARGALARRARRARRMELRREGTVRAERAAAPARGARIMGRRPAYRPRHDWVRELMAERLGAATLRAYHEMLARKLATWPALAEASVRRYALRHALIHRVEAGAWADAWRLAADMGFVEAKCRELGAYNAEVDVARAPSAAARVATRCSAGGSKIWRGRSVANRTGCEMLRRLPRGSCGTSCGGRGGAQMTSIDSSRS